MTGWDARDIIAGAFIKLELGEEPDDTEAWLRDQYIARAGLAIAALAAAGYKITTDRELIERVKNLEACIKNSGAAYDLALADANAARAEAADLQATFDLRWRADMRAIEMWKTRGEGRELTWPDHADLCVWLMGENASLKALLNAGWK